MLVLMLAERGDEKRVVLASALARGIGKTPLATHTTPTLATRNPP
jgi:hypothetical protein